MCLHLPATVLARGTLHHPWCQMLFTESSGVSQLFLRVPDHPPHRMLHPLPSTHECPRILPPASASWKHQSSLISPNSKSLRDQFKSNPYLPPGAWQESHCPAAAPADHRHEIPRVALGWAPPGMDAEIRIQVQVVYLQHASRMPPKGLREEMRQGRGDSQ